MSTLEKYRPQTETTQPTVKTVSLDWLEINCIIAGTAPQIIEHKGKQKEIFPAGFAPNIPIIAREPFDRGEFQFLPTNVRTRLFAVKYEVWYQGMQFADLYGAPYDNGFCPLNLVKIRVHNSWLYSEWHDILKELMTTINCRLKSFAQIDIACDGYNFMEPMQQVLAGKIHKVGRADWQPTLTGTGLEIKHFRIGSRGGDKYVKCYNKFHEIEKVSKKWYIFNFWKENGMQPDESVYRLEVSIKGKQVQKIAKGERVTMLKMLEMLQDPNFLASMAATEFQHMYEFVKANVPDVSKAERMYKIAWQHGVNFLKRIGVLTASHIRSVQTSIKTLFQMGVNTGARYYHQIAEEFAENSDLNDWYERRKIRWRDEAKRHKKQGRPFLQMWQSYRPGLQRTLYPV